MTIETIKDHKTSFERRRCSPAGPVEVLVTVVGDVTVSIDTAAVAELVERAMRSRGGLAHAGPVKVEVANVARLYGESGLRRYLIPAEEFKGSGSALISAETLGRDEPSAERADRLHVDFRGSRFPDSDRPADAAEPHLIAVV